MIYKLVLVSAAAAQSKRGLQTEGEAAAANQPAFDMAQLIAMIQGLKPEQLQQVAKAFAPAEATTAETATARVKKEWAEQTCKDHKENCTLEYFKQWSENDCKEICDAEKKAAKQRAEIAAKEAAAAKAAAAAPVQTAAPAAQVKSAPQPVQQQGQTAQEQATAACKTEGKVPSCGTACQANQSYSCVCQAGYVAKGASGPCEAEAAGKPTSGDKNPKAWNQFAPSTSKVTKLDANTDVEWALVNGKYVQACKYTFEETEWGTCGTLYTNQQVRTLSADVERFTTGYSCISGTKGYQIPISCTPAPGAASGAAPAPAVVPAVQQQGQTAQEQATAACKTEGKVPSCGTACQANQSYSCVCPAGHVAKGASGPCEAEAAGKPKLGDTNPKAWNPFELTGTSKVTKLDANTDVEWALVNGKYVQACKYTFEETEWGTCGTPYTNQKVRTLSADVERFTTGYSCISGTKGYQIPISCTPAPGAAPVAAPAPAVVPAAKTTVQQTAQSTQSSANTTVQQTAQEQATAACAEQGKVPDCENCKAGVNFRCVCKAGQVLKGQTPPQTCEDEAKGKPAANSGAAGKQVVTKEGNTRVAWASNGTEYVQVCKYQETESACGENKLKSRKISDPEFYSPALGQSCPLASEYNVACSP